ncbi:MAG: dihydropteroate synthase, partial [Fuerstiella sp.]
LTDANFRIFAEQTGVHLMNKHGHWSGQQPFEIFDSALQANPGIDAGHAFYLGYEMARAEVARLLGKQYTQDEGISFGLAGQLEGSASVHHKSAFSENPET